MAPGIVVSAPASGTGKTTVTLGLARAFAQKGLRVQCFKCGPDYIDPAFHAAASGRTSFNLDSWAMSRDMIEDLAAHGNDCDLVIAEGSMGLFDGVARKGACGIGASADIAELMGWPVVLVIDPAGQAQTAAAVAKGLSLFRPGVRIAGVILNRVASPRHEALVRAGMEGIGIPVLGVLQRQSQITLPERHLGLVQAQELSHLSDLIDAVAQQVAMCVDLDAVLQVAGLTMLPAQTATLGLLHPPGQRIALANDAAFSFLYPHLLEGWRKAGAEIVPFSPLADEAPDVAADACWLPGGYPELHAGRLAGANRFRNGLASYAATRPVHGECGGYMVMGCGLVDAQGLRHEMTGLLGLETSFATRKMHLGYRRAHLTAPIPGYQKGMRLRGHEFHYASILAQPDQPLAAVSDANGTMVSETGSRRGHATGSFFHVIAEDI